MERLKLIEAVRSSLTELRTLGASLKENFSVLSDELDAEKFLSFERLNSVRNDLISLIEEENSCRDLFERVFKDSPPESFAQVERLLVEKEIKILETSIYGRARKFLRLETEVPEYQKSLARHQKKLQALFGKKDFNAKAEATAEPYAKFIDAMNAPSTGAKIAMIQELRNSFDDNFIGAGLFDGDLFLKETEVPVVEPEEIAPAAPEESEFVKILHDKDAFLTDDDFAPWEEKFSVDKTDRDKEISAKRVKSDYKNTIFSKAVFAMAVGRGCVALSTLPKKIFTAESFENTAQSLLQKGYLQKFAFKDFGEFYGLTKKFSDLLRNDSNKKIVNLLSPDYKNTATLGSFLEEDARAALPRAVYFRIHAHEQEPDNSPFAVEFYSQAFRAKFHNDDNGLIVGCFWDEPSDCDKFLKKLRQYLREESKPFWYVIVAGLTLEHAEKIVDALTAALAEDFPRDANIYLYSAADDAFYWAETHEEILPEEVFSSFKVESIEDLPPEEPSDDEPIDVEPINVEPTAAPAAQIDIEPPDDDDEPVKDLPGDVLSVVCKMIADKKFYCATAYLKACSLQNAAVVPLYRRVAYALDDPLLDAAYSSDEILTLLGANLDAFDETLVTAAAIRAFFYNRTEYDYIISNLYDEIKNFKLLRTNETLTQLVHDFKEFKFVNQKGTEYFCGYETQDTREVREKLAAVVRDAEEHFIRLSDYHGETFAFARTKQILFAPEGDFNKIFTIVKTTTNSADAKTLARVKTFFRERFLRNNSDAVDKDKLNDWVQDCWDQAKDPSRSDEIVGNWRSNLIKNLERAAKIMSEWIECVEKLSNSEQNPHARFFAEVTTTLDATRKSFAKELKGKSVRAAGLTVLDETLKEISKQLNGTFSPWRHEYFYVDFLCGDDVILDENRLPKFDLNIKDGTDKLLPEQIERHANKKKLPGARERIVSIVEKKGDNFGAARILDDYLQATEGASFIAAQKYRLDETVSATAKDAARDREEFTGGVAFAQIHGQLQGMPDTKETILQIIDSCYDYAEASKNYGVFFRVKKFWDDTIKQNAADLAEDLRDELAQAADEYKKNVGDDGSLSQRVDAIDEIISLGIFPKAQRKINELRAGKQDDENSDDDDNDSTLSRFLDDYDDCRKRVQDVSKSLKVLLAGRSGDKNKFERAKSDLIDSWLPNGMPDADSGQGHEKIRDRVKALLPLLGFGELESVELVAEDSDAKSLNYEVKLKKSFQIKHKHPIAAFGSGAEADKAGFRVVCLFGQFTHENIIDYCKRFDKGNTLILLDDALKLLERRRLAKALKANKTLMHVFAVVDRVVIMYLHEHCKKQIGNPQINDTLMALIMPFSRCQPYIWAPNKPLPPEMFKGREDEMSKIKSPNGVNIVYGGRQLGKSALLKMARRQLDGNNNQRAILVDIRNQDFEEAALAVSRDLTAKNFFVEPVETNDWDELARAIQARLSTDEPAKISYFLLMLDEADTFIETCAEVDYEPINALSRVQQEDYNGALFKFVIAGLHNVVRFEKKAQENNGILPMLPPLTITPFRFEEASELLKVPLRYLGLRFPDDRFIYTIEETALYYPGLIQLFCEKLLLTLFDSNDYGADAPPYELKETHIKKILSDQDFLDNIKKRINITLTVDDDKNYYVIAQLLAYLYHKRLKVDGYSPREILELAETDDFKDLLDRNLLPADERKINAFMLELCELNILRKSETDASRYKFASQTIYRYMGTAQQIYEELFNLMTGADNG